MSTAIELRQVDILNCYVITMDSCNVSSRLNSKIPREAMLAVSMLTLRLAVTKVKSFLKVCKQSIHIPLMVLLQMTKRFWIHGARV
jgi:hypothetical protein